MPSGFRTNRNHEITTGFLMLDGMSRFPGKGSNLDSLAMRRFDKISRRRSQSIDDKLDRMAHGLFDHFKALAGGEVHSLHNIAADRFLLPFRKRRNSRIVQHLAHEIDMLLRQQFFRFIFQVSGVFNIAGHQNVYAIGLALNMIINPVEFFFHSVRIHSCHTENPHASGLGDFDDHVPAMRKCKDWHVNTEHFAEFVFHCDLSFLLSEKFCLIEPMPRPTP